MLRMAAITTLALLVGCTEYDVIPELDIKVEPNPPDLSTPIQTDRIVQVTHPAVDVLWVVDNSCSMSEEQDALVANFPRFINYFVGADLDYHIGVISTAYDEPVERGALREYGGRKWIDATVSNPEALFVEMADIGVGGLAADIEKGRAQTYTALGVLGNSLNAGFEREDANLAIVVISDENDYSGNDPISKPDFITWLLERKADPDMVTFSSIVGPYGGCSSAFETGVDYLQVTEAVGGISWSICDERWDLVLEELGIQAAGLKREFFLSDIPVVDTVRVWVEHDSGSLDYEAVVDYEYSRMRNSISFLDIVPPPLAEVFIEYEILAAQQGLE